MSRPWRREKNNFVNFYAYILYLIRSQGTHHILYHTIPIVPSFWYTFLNFFITVIEAHRSQYLHQGVEAAGGDDDDIGAVDGFGDSRSFFSSSIS